MTTPSLFENVPEETPIITMWRPWANWVALGWKSIESRTHRKLASLAGRRIGILAGAKWDDEALVLARPYLDDWKLEETGLWKRKVESMVLCTAFVRAHRRLVPDDEREALIECTTERFGLILEDVEILSPFVEMKGAQAIRYAVLPKGEPLC